MDIQNYIDSTAIDCINEGKDIPTWLHNHEFKLKYVSTDGWRGYYNAVPTKKSKWIQIENDWVTGDWDDAGEHASSKTETRQQRVIETVEKNGGDLVIILTPTSNVFSTGMDVFVRGLSSAIINSLTRLT